MILYLVVATRSPVTGVLSSNITSLPYVEEEMGLLVVLASPRLETKQRSSFILRSGAFHLPSCQSSSEWTMAGRRGAALGDRPENIPGSTGQLSAASTSSVSDVIITQAPMR